MFEGKKSHTNVSIHQQSLKQGVRWNSTGKYNYANRPKKTGIKAKVENKGQYQQYLDELKPLREELGITLKEDLYPEAADKISN